MKLIYDTDAPAGEKVFIENADGTKHFFPFYKLKVYDGWRVTNIDCWPDEKLKRKYFAEHPEKDATPK